MVKRIKFMGAFLFFGIAQAPIISHAACELYDDECVISREIAKSVVWDVKGMPEIQRRAYMAVQKAMAEVLLAEERATAEGNVYKVPDYLGDGASGVSFDELEKEAHRIKNRWKKRKTREFLSAEDVKLMQNEISAYKPLKKEKVLSMTAGAIKKREQQQQLTPEQRQEINKRKSENRRINR